MEGFDRVDQEGWGRGMWPLLAEIPFPFPSVPPLHFLSPDNWAEKYVIGVLYICAGRWGELTRLEVRSQN